MTRVNALPLQGDKSTSRFQSHLSRRHVITSAVFIKHPATGGQTFVQWSSHFFSSSSSHLYSGDIMSIIYFCFVILIVGPALGETAVQLIPNSPSQLLPPSSLNNQTGSGFWWLLQMAFHFPRVCSHNDIMLCMSLHSPAVLLLLSLWTHCSSTMFPQYVKTPDLIISQAK